MYYILKYFNMGEKPVGNLELNNFRTRVNIILMVILFSIMIVFAALGGLS